MSFLGGLVENIWVLLRIWISSDASTVSSASMSRHSDLPDPVKAKVVIGDSNAFTSDTCMVFFHL